jgi:hypothetical protein
MRIFSCFRVKNNDKCPEKELYKRMQYLYELNVPLRYRWKNPSLNWELIYNNVVDDIDYFRNDEKLQALKKVCINNKIKV